MQIVVPTLAGLTRFIHCLLLLHIHTIEILVTFLLVDWILLIICRLTVIISVSCLQKCRLKFPVSTISSSIRIIGLVIIVDIVRRCKILLIVPKLLLLPIVLSEKLLPTLINAVFAASGKGS